MNNYRPTAQYRQAGKQERKCQPNLAAACVETVQAAAKWLYHLIGIREFASNDRHVFLEVVVRSWTNSHRNEVELVLHGRTTAGCLHGDSCVGTPRVLGKLLAI